MRSPEDIAALVSKRLMGHRFDLDESAWPYRVTTQLPARRVLEENASSVHRWNRKMLAWARNTGCEVSSERRVMGTPVELAAAVTVPDVGCALGIAGSKVKGTYLRAKRRFALVRERFEVPPETAMGVVRLMDREEDLDFSLMLEASSYLSSHDCAGLTARQIPLAGFSAKWLGTASSRRRQSICLLLGVGDLGLAERPGEVRWHRLDPSFARLPERLVTSADQDDGLPAPRYVLIVENKDSYLWMPPIESAACIWGSGRAASRMVGLLPWLQGADVLYWGDMDADGFEILASLREAGLSCESLLMDWQAYGEYERYGTKLTPEGKPIARREPKQGLTLTDEEQRLYSALCTGEGVSCLRIEQERIPLTRAADELRKRGWPVC